MGLPQEKVEERFTYRHYREWPDDERWELIHGISYAMSPAPTLYHQSIVFELGRQIGNFFETKPCRAFTSPIDVLFAGANDKNDDYAETVVQPDVVVVCDNKKLSGRYIKGAPDLVVEVLSPSTASKDLKQKYKLYESHGVKEYWIVYPHEKSIMLFSLLTDGTYGKPAIYTVEDVIEDQLFEGLTVDLTSVFRELGDEEDNG